jgi:hypothetical protein
LDYKTDSQRKSVTEMPVRTQKRAKNVPKVKSKSMDADENIREVSFWDGFVEKLGGVLEFYSFLWVD